MVASCDFPDPCDGAAGGRAGGAHQNWVPLGDFMSVSFEGHFERYLDISLH